MSKANTDPIPRISWENFRDVYLSTSAPGLLRVLAAPIADISSEPSKGRIALRIRYDGTAELPTNIPKAITVQSVIVSGDRFVEISTSHQSIFRPFFFFLLSIRDLLAQAELSPIKAFAAALKESRELLEAEPLLSEERLLGLYGELWTLQYLIRTLGALAVAAWTGPRRLPHDFRYGRYELEVKTTRSAQRLHRIHGINQLEPSQGCQLFLISVHAEPTGPEAGHSVPDIVSSIQQSLASSTEHADIFEQLLNAAGYEKNHRQLYMSRFTMRDHPRLIPVDATFPILERTILQNGLSPDAWARISNIDYTLDVTGLGVEIENNELARVIATGDGDGPA